MAAGVVWREKCCAFIWRSSLGGLQGGRMSRPSREEIAVALFADLADPQIQEP